MHINIDKSPPSSIIKVEIKSRKEESAMVRNTLSRSLCFPPFCPFPFKKGDIHCA